MEKNMQVLIVILVVVGTFGLCFLLDKGYTKLFRGKAQHRSGICARWHCSVSHLQGFPV